MLQESDVMSLSCVFYSPLQSKTASNASITRMPLYTLNPKL